MIRRTLSGSGRNATGAPGVVEFTVGPPDTPGEWSVERMTVQCLPAGAAAPVCYVYRGASSDSHVPVDATAAGNYDVSECVPPIDVPDSTELTFRWLAVPAGSTVRAEVDYTMDDTTGGDGA